MADVDLVLTHGLMQRGAQAIAELCPALKATDIRLEMALNTAASIQTSLAL